MRRAKRLLTASIFACGVLYLHHSAKGESDMNGIVQYEGPLEKLPSYVPSKEGALSLFADFERKTTLGAPVYFVNRTGKPIDFQSQDGDVYLKLEYEQEPGVWVRAQPHAYSDCGNSYLIRPHVNSDDFMIVNGYVPAEGVKAKVRYRLYKQGFEAVSNTGEGLVNEKDIARAASDLMTLQTADFNFIRRVALGELVLKNEMDHNTDLRVNAIWILKGRTPKVFNPKEVAPLLKRLSEEKGSPYAEPASRALNSLEKEMRESTEPSNAPQEPRPDSADRPQESARDDALPSIGEIHSFRLAMSFRDVDEKSFRDMWKRAKPLRPEDPILKNWHYSPWFEADFSDGGQAYHVRLFLGGLGFLSTADGQKKALLISEE